MEFALDKDNNRIDAWDVAFEELKSDFFCPVCGEQVIFRHGDVNVPHFAHKKGNCTDSWHYDMSEWHKSMQSCFPPENREVVVTYKGQKHRADILINKTVIEFQHSPISASEFNDRNSLFNALGYRIAWVFDVSEEWNSGRIECIDHSSCEKYKWNWAMRIFDDAPKISDYNKTFSLWLNFGMNDSGNGEFEITKVVWAVHDEYGKQSLKRFVIANNYLDLKDGIPIDELFYSKLDYLNDALKELRKISPYTLKYIGEKGHKRDEYMCPRRPGEFGLHPFGEKACRYCRYCALICNKKRNGKTQRTIYCCYPNQIRELMEVDSGYECPATYEYNL